MSNTEQNNARAFVSFASIDPYLQTNIVSPKETLVASKDLVEWGDKNAYPDYLLDLYNNVPTLRSIINGNIDYITGDDVLLNAILPTLGEGVMNRKGDTIRDQVKDIAKDFEIYGGFALQVIRNFSGEVAEVYYVDMRYLRTNKEGNVFYYCEKWNKPGKKDTLVYPAFLPFLEWDKLTPEERARHASSILFVKNIHTQVYPAPLYGASVKACELERNIDNYHLNAINNGFVSSVMINFNNGIPSDEIKAQIENDFNEKFSGHQNAGRIMFSWNPSKEAATTITPFKTEDFGEKYDALAKHSRQQIFTAFRANPNLFGIPTDNNGFSNEEYTESFKLYNRTQIQPIQRLIAETYEKVFKMKGVLTIVPFSMGGETEDNIS